MSASIDKLLFAAASEMTDAEERRLFLDHACKDDPNLRKLLDEMLEVRDEAEDFFTPPPEEVDLPGEIPQTDDEILSTQIGRYKLTARIGSGGCGVVYLAEQQAPVRRKVALKIIRLGMDTENVIARFELERQALALMDHPNIARVLDAGATGAGRPYFVMELADGEKITDFCDRRQLGLRGRLELFILICEAIQHAHQKGVVHRDIKPSNVLVREHDNRVVPKVIDFGIAKVTAPELDGDHTATSPGQFIGTPAYMSPEQAEGGVDIDTRSDIYSLGALLCELLMGSPPLKPEELHGHGVEEIRRMLREGRNRAPSIRLKTLPKAELEELARRRDIDPQKLAPAIAGDLDWIVMKATETERQRRYETANGLAMDVQRHLNDEPVLARPPSRWYLLTKTVRRNRMAFAAGGTALLALLAGLGVSTWLFLQERSARHEQARLRMIAEQATANEVRLREDANVGDQVRQAAVFLRYNDNSRADKLLEGLPAEKVPRSLEAANTFMAIGNWNLRQERFKTAGQRFNTLGRVLTSVDMRDSERISFDFLSVATAVCVWGEPGQYDALRKLAIARFGNSANPIVAEHTLKATLLKPADPEMLEKLLPLAYVLEASLSRMDKSSHLMAWQQFSLALLSFRRGDLETSADLATRSLALASNSAPRTVSDKLLLAMIDLRHGKPDSARKSIRALRREVDGWLKGPFQLVNADGTLWYNQYAVLMLLEEAEAMLPRADG